MEGCGVQTVVPTGQTEETAASSTTVPPFRLSPTCLEEGRLAVAAATAKHTMSF